jgi:hypothetical protein
MASLGPTRDAPARPALAPAGSERVFDATGLPVHEDNQTALKVRSGFKAWQRSTPGEAPLLDPFVVSPEEAARHDPRLPHMMCAHLDFSPEVANERGTGSHEALAHQFERRRHPVERHSDRCGLRANRGHDAAERWPCDQ